jgi:hypothetical protein
MTGTGRKSGRLTRPVGVGRGTVEERQHADQRQSARLGAKIVQVIEVTPGKKVVWALRDWTTFGPALQR